MSGLLYSKAARPLMVKAEAVKLMLPLLASSDHRVLRTHAHARALTCVTKTRPHGTWPLR